LGAFPKGLGPCDSQDKILGITIPLFFLSEGEERRGEEREKTWISILQ
jgi:hypothetical protein